MATPDIPRFRDALEVRRHHPQRFYSQRFQKQIVEDAKRYGDAYFETPDEAHA